MTIYFSQHASREGWVSFETDPRLRQTKERLNRRCLPCLTDLLEQLKVGGESIELPLAWDCWKVVAVLPDREQCLELLAQFSEAYPEEYVYGKMGTGRGRTTVAVMFHTEQEQRRDELLALLCHTVDLHLPGGRVFASRGCADPYERLLGPWAGWRAVSPIRHPERVDAVRKNLRESLYGRG